MAFLESAGYEGYTAEDLRSENFLYPDEKPPFDVTPDGKVICTRDGLLVRSYRQTHAQVLYWQEVEWGGPGLVHDEKAEAFYTPDGKLAVSRTDFDLRLLLGKSREEWLRSEYHEDVSG